MKAGRIRHYKWIATGVAVVLIASIGGRELWHRFASQRSLGIDEKVEVLAEEINKRPGELKVSKSVFAPPALVGSGMPDMLAKAKRGMWAAAIANLEKSYTGRIVVNNREALIKNLSTAPNKEKATSILRKGLSIRNLKTREMESPEITTEPNKDSVIFSIGNKI